MKLHHDIETEYSVDKPLIPKYEADNHRTELFYTISERRISMVYELCYIPSLLSTTIDK